MTNIIKRIISKRSKVRTFEYTGNTVYIPNNVTHVLFHSSVTEVHDEAFRGCSKLKEVVFSDGITTIGDGSFKGCKRLKRVVLDYGLKQIGDDAFANCVSLDSITFPSTVIKIGDRAFEDCSTLKQVIHMNEGVGIKYGWDVFHGCQLAMKKYRITKIIEISHLKELEQKIDEVGSTTQLRDENITILLTQPNPNIVRRQNTSRDKIGNLIQYYEVKEATTLVELALWKAEISQSDEEVYPTNRHAYRVEVPGPAKDLILQYAYHIPLHTTTCYRIYIKCSRGEGLVAIKVEPSDTIAYIKKQMHDDKGIALDQQQLFFNGSELLHDDCTLSDCNIMRDSIIICFEISGN